MSPKVLAIPTIDGEFLLDTDASNHAIGAHLMQCQKGVWKTIAYGSFTMSKAQRRYCTTKQELLSVVRFLNHFRHYLIGKKFRLRTDHHSLMFAYNFKKTEGQMARWLQELSRFNFNIEYRKGTLHVIPDAFSRVREPIDCDEYRHRTSIKDLPCGGCKWCRKKEAEWGNFLRDVDDVIEWGDEEDSIREIKLVDPVELRDSVFSNGADNPQESEKIDIGLKTKRIYSN